MDNANEPAVQYRRRDVLRVCSSYYHNTPRDARMAIIKRIAKAYGYTEEQILGSVRRQPLAAVRQLCMRAVADEFPQDSMPKLGRLFNRNHTTVLYALTLPQEHITKWLEAKPKRRKIAVGKHGDNSAPILQPRDNRSIN